MNIIKVISEIKYEFPCVVVAPGNNGILHSNIPLVNIIVDELPKGLNAIIAGSDFQAYDSADIAPNERNLMGLIISNELKRFADERFIPNSDNIGIILAGDFYADPLLEKRGGAGNVQNVWDSFESSFRWTVGVAGNHDRFYNDFQIPEEMNYLSCPAILDGQFCKRDGIQIGGISGIIGNPNRPWRKSENDFIDLINNLVINSSILILHEGPAIAEVGAKGSAMIRSALESIKRNLITVSAHSHWHHHYYRINETVHAINVDFRVVIFTESEIDKIH